MPQQAQSHLQGQGDHGQQQKLHDRELQQAHALKIFSHPAPEDGIHQASAEQVVAAYDNRAENALAQVRRDAEDVRQVAIHLVDEAVVVPRLAGPEPLPSRAANKRADDDHRDPEDDEAEQKRPDREPALLPCVIAAAERVGVDVGNYHQTNDDHRGHHDAGDPGIEIDEHLLQAEEVPGSLGRIHCQVRIGGFFEWRVEGDRPDHQDDGDDDRGEKFDAKEEWPDVYFFGPARFERPGLAMVRLGHRRIGFKLLDENVVGVRLLPREVDVESEQRNQAHNRDVVGGRADFPKLSPVHSLSTNHVGTAAFGRPVEQSSTSSTPSAKTCRASLDGRTNASVPTQPKSLSGRFRASAGLVGFFGEHDWGWAGDAAIFSYAPEVDDHQHAGHDRDANAVPDIGAEQGIGVDDRSA